MDEFIRQKKQQKQNNNCLNNKENNCRNVMSNGTHENSPIIEQNNHHHTRENLLSRSNRQQIQMSSLPMLGVLGQSMIRADADQHLRHQVFISIFNLINLRRTIYPDIQISKYKYFAEMFMLLFCTVEMVFFELTLIHIIWLLWYSVLGSYRHWIINRKIRFFGELINLSVWIFTHCYIFSHHKDGIFPVIFLVANIDYYFIGSSLIKTYYCFFCFMVWNCYANFRLKIIVKKMIKKRKQFIKQRLTKYREYEKKNQLKQEQLSQNQHQSLQRMEKQINLQQQQDDRNNCPICLSCLYSHVDFGQKNLRILRLECSHRYHYGCLKSWIETGHYYCPVCKTDFIK